MFFLIFLLNYGIVSRHIREVEEERFTMKFKKIWLYTLLNIIFCPAVGYSSNINDQLKQMSHEASVWSPVLSPRRLEQWSGQDAAWEDFKEWRRKRCEHLSRLTVRYERDQPPKHLLMARVEVTIKLQDDSTKIIPLEIPRYFLSALDTEHTHVIDPLPHEMIVDPNTPDFLKNFLETTISNIQPSSEPLGSTEADMDLDEDERMILEATRKEEAEMTNLSSEKIQEKLKEGIGKFLVKVGEHDENKTQENRLARHKGRLLDQLCATNDQRNGLKEKHGKKVSFRKFKKRDSAYLYFLKNNEALLENIKQEILEAVPGEEKRRNIRLSDSEQGLVPCLAESDLRKLFELYPQAIAMFREAILQGVTINTISQRYTCLSCSLYYILQKHSKQIIDNFQKLFKQTKNDQEPFFNVYVAPLRGDMYEQPHDGGANRNTTVMCKSFIEGGGS